MNDKQAEQEFAVINVLDATRKPLTLEEIAKRTGMVKHIVRYPIRRLEKAEVVKRSRRGLQTFFELSAV
jgi:predicted transcriptional regulator